VKNVNDLLADDIMNHMLMLVTVTSVVVIALGSFADWCNRAPRDPMIKGSSVTFAKKAQS